MSLSRRTTQGGCFDQEMTQFDEALSQLASLHAQEVARIELELQTKIQQLQASLLEAEALKMAADEPETLVAVIEHITQELQEDVSTKEEVLEEPEQKSKGLAKSQSVTFEDERREGSSRLSGDEKTMLEMLECQKGLLTSSMNQEARSKLYRMQEEMNKKEKAIGEINSRVRHSKDGQADSEKPKITLHGILSSRSFGLCVASMILFNSILLGLDVNRNKAVLEEQILVVLGEMCNAFFFIELMLRLWCYKAVFFYGDEMGWNLFDYFLVLTSVLDVILTYTAAEMSPAVAGSVKMLKLFRIMRVFRVFRFFRQLANWAMMILDSLKSLFGALILLGIIIYVFAVSLSMNTADWLTLQENNGSADVRLITDVDTWFGSLGKTLYTLLLSILGGVSWHLVCDLLLEIDILSATLLLFYIMFTIFSVLNVITGVFVDSAIQTSNSQRDIQIEREMELKDSFLKSLKGFFEALDTDGSGSIHLEEIKIMLQDPTLAAYFAVLGFDEVNANQIFHLLDDDESGEVSIEEFLDGCSKLKGAARSIDVHALMHQCRALHRELTYVASNLGVDMQSAAALASRPQWFGRSSGARTTQAIINGSPGPP